MRLQYFSDLHLEFYKKHAHLIEAKAPILVLCGDIGDPAKPLYETFLSTMSSQFEKIFLLCGNHEYYHKTIPITHALIRTICEKYPNISFLQNSFEDYQGFRFAGTTLWSHISDPRHLINDFHCIQDFTIETCNQLHQESREFIQDMLDTSPHPIVMMTHHLPSHALTDPFYSVDNHYQQCFSSSSDDLIRPPIHCFVYGHTHRGFQGTLQGIKMYCNPIGYPGENIHTDFHKIIEF